MIPTTKISLTLLEYAEPLINELEDDYSKSELENVLRIATCVWNACVIDQWHNTDKNVEDLKEHISKSGDFIPAVIVDALIQRKRQSFGGDLRAITNECVVVKNGEFVVRAEARIDLQNMPVDSGRVN